jgi:hypothetical protein
MAELNQMDGLSLNLAPSKECRIGTPTNTGSEGRLILIGVSHMGRAREFLPDDVVVLALPRGPPGAASSSRRCMTT